MSGHTGGVVGGATRIRGVTRAALAVLLLLVVLAAAAPARADAGLDVTSTSRYVLHPDEGTVSATITVTLRNVAPNEPTADGGYRFYYYDAYALPLPAEATDVRATSAGAGLSVTTRAIGGEGGFSLFEIGFPDLVYPSSRTIELTFTLEGQPPRSQDPTRIGDGYATFPVFGPGDPGQNLVEVVVPDGFELDSTSSSFTPTEGSDGVTVHSTREDNLGPGFAATMSLRGAVVGEEREVTVGGVDLVLVPYPDDPQWADFIEERADVGLPVLVELLGRPWPGDIDRIREDSGSQVRGFEGWYSRRDREIVLGEALQDGILYHELAHAWVNTATVEDRWLSEGLAEFLAEATAERTGGTFTTPRAVARDEPAALPLRTWEESPGFRGTEVDAWAYPASYRVVDELLDGLDDGALSELLGDAVTARSPWDLPEQEVLSGGALRSTTFYDLLVEHATPSALDGSAEDLYAEWVLDADLVGRLGQRAAATEAYAGFASASAWGPPLGIRRAMADWEFAEARDEIAERTELAGAATAVHDLSQRTGTPLPERVRRAYEGAESEGEYAAAAASIATATNSLRRYEQARAASEADRTVLGRLGATVLRVAQSADVAQDAITAGEFAVADAASELALDRAPWSTRVGLGLVAAAVLLLLVVTRGAVALLRRGRRRAIA